MMPIVDDLKSKLKERLNWNTFKKEMGQGFDTMPQVGMSLVPTELSLLRRLIQNKKFVPKIFHHGTPSAFENIDPSKLQGAAFGKGFYLTESPSMASIYASERIPFTTSTEYAPNIKSYFIDTDLTRVDPRRITGSLRKQLSKKVLTDPATYYPDVKEMVVTDPNVLTSIWSERGQLLFELLKKAQLLQK